MTIRNPLKTALIFSLAMSVPATMAVAQGERASVYESKKADKGGGGKAGKDKGGKDKGGQNKGGQNNGGGGQGGQNGGGGEDMTKMRFQGMDTNRDGMISRDEWRGNDNSFDQHDWNGDGVLSGIEVTPGAQRPVDFGSLDRNDDGRISPSEWPGSRFFFTLLDDDQDGFLSAAELGQDGGVFARGRLEEIFRALDDDRNNRLSQAEWPGTAMMFDRADTNDDNAISFDELRRAAGMGGDGGGEAEMEAEFNRMDDNNDDRISRSEWRGKARQFDRLDRNRDNFLTLDEFLRR